MKSKKVKVLVSLIICSVLLTMFTIPAFAASNVTDTVAKIWGVTKSEFKTLCNTVIFPICDFILLILFIIKLATAYLAYRKNGQIEWTGPVLLFVGLVIMLTAPLYIWDILGL